MSDDLAQILKSIRNTQQNILDRLAEVERGIQSSGASVLPSPGSYGYTSPTSPPSERILVRGGVGWYRAMKWQGWPDFVATPSISAFTSAYYYRWIVPYLDVINYYYTGPDSGLFRLHEDTEEYSTYEECATAISNDIILKHTWTPGGYADPVITLCAIAIRNDGTTGAVNSYLPITLSDRTKSSFIIRDLRPWFWLTD